MALAFVGGACGSDPCANGTCGECTVETEDADCGDHEYCDVTDDGRTCECVTGYTATPAGCTWTGTIRDPGFEQQPSPWIPVGGAVLEPTAGGGLDPGQAGFPPSALCSLGHVDQSVDMPTYAKAEPLVLELAYKNPIDAEDGDRVLAGVSFGGGWSPLPYFDDGSFHTLRVCLPEGGYAARDAGGAGGPVTLAIGPYTPAQACPDTALASFAIDHAAIVPANLGECGTVPGVGPNADAEGDGGWTFTVSGSSTGGFVAGAGQDGSRGAQIRLGHRCDVAAMKTSFNVPVVQNPALELYLDVAAGARGLVVVGDDVWSTGLPPGGTATTIRTCVPPSLRGQTMAIAFHVSGGAGLCSDTLGHTLAADNLRVVDDPSCLSNANISNHGFEHGGQPFGAFAYIAAATGALAVVRNEPGMAHGGTRYLALESYGRCTSSGITLLPTVPAPVGVAGPALKFFAAVGNNANAVTYVTAANYGRWQTLVEGGGYHPYTVCLDPRFAGRPQVVTIAHDGGSGLCDTTGYGQQSAFIDDVELTTDATCPAY